MSRLGRSVSPVIALRDLAIQPSPELTVTSFSEKRTEIERDDVLGEDGRETDTFGEEYSVGEGFELMRESSPKAVSITCYLVDLEATE